MSGPELARPACAPYLCVSDSAAAIAWYLHVFGGRELYRQPADDGKRLMHADLELGNGGRIYLSDDFPEWTGGRTPDTIGGTPVTVHLQFAAGAAVDAVFTQAVEAGAVVELAPNDAFWGDRFAVFRDPFGHRWSLGGTIG